MGSTSSISGLASGLDSASIVDQLMKLEAQSQTRLKSQLSTQQGVLKSLQALNAKIAALATQAKDLSTANAWTSLRATSSDPAVTARPTGGATSSFDITVGQLATATRVGFATPVAPGDVVTNGATFDLTVDGVTRTLDAGSGTIASVAGAVNGSGSGVAATVVHTDAGDRLVLQASATGAGHTISLAGVDALGATTTTAGQNAEITVVGVGTVSSASNTFSSAVSGVELTLTAVPTGTVHVEVRPDATAAKDKAKALVDGLNQVLTQLDALTSYDAATKTGGPLTGDATVRALRSSLLETIFPTDGTTLAAVGIETDRYGKLVLKEDAFNAAYAADPAKVVQALAGGATSGFADRLADAATAASDRHTGTLTGAITGRTSSIDRIQDSIDSWDLRLELRRTTLTRQFTALETALSQMNSQSTWLAGQISKLGSSGSQGG